MEISIIVPVYNVEKYLERCIDSILNQNFKDFELILVDDGSTDKSGEICDKYAKRYSYIRVIHKENGGPSEARNEGILQANGKYVTYIDSDDLISSDYLDCLFNALCHYKADVSCAKFAFFSDDSPLNNTSQISHNSRVYTGENACLALLYEKNFQTSSCNILLKKEIALKNLFPEGKYHEDDMTTFRYFLSANKVVMTDSVTYFYYQREGSIMHTDGQPVLDEIAAANNYPLYCKKYSKKLYKASLCKKYSLYLCTIVNYPSLKQNNPKLYEDVKKYLVDHSIDILFDIRSSVNIKKQALRLLLHIDKQIKC